MEDGTRHSGKRILGLDVGLRRIGLALSDPLGITAQGLETMKRIHLRADLARLCRLAAAHDVGLFVIGYPLHLSGGEGRQAQLVRGFAEQLAERCGIEVRLWDERFTTVEANRVLSAGGATLDKRAKAIDRLSAVLILQSYLDSLAESLPGIETE